MEGADDFAKPVMHESSSKKKEKPPRITETTEIARPNPNTSRVDGTLTTFNPNTTGNGENDIPAVKNLPEVSNSPRNQPLKVAKENLNKLMIPKHVQTQIVDQHVALEEEEPQTRGGKDLDEESTTQNS